MRLSESKISRIFEFGRSAAKSQSPDEVVKRAFETLKEVARVDSFRVVYLFDHSIWQEWRASVKRTSTSKSDTWIAPEKRGATVYFDSSNTQIGYLTVSPKTSPAVTATNMLAPAVWNALLLQSALRRVQRAAKLETELVRAALRAREEERLRIARELHDDLGQSMASLKLSLKWAEDVARERGGLDAVIDELAGSRESVALMIGKIRDLSQTLYPKILDTLGLPAAVKELTHLIGNSSGMEVTCNVSGKEKHCKGNRSGPLPMLSGIDQQRLETRECILSLRRGSLRRSGSWSDCGRQRPGFQPQSSIRFQRKNDELGLLDIRQRMEDLGGAFSLSTAGGQGTVVEMIVPFSVRENNGRRKNKNTDSR